MHNVRAYGIHGTHIHRTCGALVNVHSVGMQCAARMIIYFPFDSFGCYFFSLRFSSNKINSARQLGSYLQMKSKKKKRGEEVITTNHICTCASVRASIRCQRPARQPITAHHPKNERMNKNENNNNRKESVESIVHLHIY